MTDGNGTREKLGAYGAQIEYIEDRLDKIEMSLRGIETTLNQARGGWRTLCLISGVSATVGAGVAKIIPFLNLMK